MVDDDELGVANYLLAVGQGGGPVDGSSAELALDSRNVRLVCVEVDGDENPGLLGCCSEHGPHLRRGFEVVRCKRHRLSSCLDKTVKLTGETTGGRFVPRHRPYRSELIPVTLGSADRMKHGHRSVDVPVPEPGGAH